MPNKLLSPKNLSFVYCFYFICSEIKKKELSFPPLHQADAKFNETLSDNQDPHSNIENDETPKTEYPCENDSKD